MVITLFATYYENKSMVAARRWRSLVCFLCKDGVQVFVVTPGDEKNEYSGEFGESVLVFKSARRKKPVKSVAGQLNNRKPIDSPFPSLDVSLLVWLGSFRDKRVKACCLQTDLLISTYGPAGAMLAGLWFTRKYNKPWVLDLRDSFQVPSSYSSRPLSWLNRFVEKAILRKAALRLTVGEVLGRYLRLKYQTQFECIYNGWLDSDVFDMAKSKAEKRHFLYAGSIYEHQLNALKVFLDGLLEQQHCVLRIRLIRDYSGRLDAWLIEQGFEAIVQVMPPVSREELQLEIKASRAVLVLEELKPDDWQKGTVTGKLFSLLVSGVPGVVISDPSVELYSLAAKAEGWFCAHDKASAVKALESILSYDSATGGGNLELFEPYHFSLQAKKLKKLCEGVINEYY